MEAVVVCIYISLTSLWKKGKYISQSSTRKTEQVEYTHISNKDGKIHQYINNNENKGSGVLQINRDLLKTRENSHIEVTSELF